MILYHGSNMVIEQPRLIIKTSWLEDKVMGSDKFSSMLFLLVPQVVQLIKDTKQLDEEKATELLYESEIDLYIKERQFA